MAKEALEGQTTRQRSKGVPSKNEETDGQPIDNCNEREDKAATFLADNGSPQIEGVGRYSN